MPLSCSLPKNYLITTDNCIDDYYYLTSVDGLIAHSEDADYLFQLAWLIYRKQKKESALGGP
jgi:hypothetical protein